LDIDLHCLRPGFETEEPDLLATTIPPSVRVITLSPRSALGVQLFAEILRRFTEAAPTILPSLTTENYFQPTAWHSELFTPEEGGAILKATGVELQLVHTLHVVH
jgi:hypothetical protein